MPLLATVLLLCARASGQELCSRDFQAAIDGVCQDDCGITYNKLTHYLPDPTCVNRVPQRCGEHCSRDNRVSPTGANVDCTNRNRGCPPCRNSHYDLGNTCRVCGYSCMIGEYPTPLTCKQFPDSTDRLGQGCSPCENRDAPGVVVTGFRTGSASDECEFRCASGYFRTGSTCQKCYQAPCPDGHYHTICQATKDAQCSACVLPNDATATGAGTVPGDPYGCPWVCKPGFHLSSDGTRCVACELSAQVECTSFGGYAYYPVFCDEARTRARCEPCPAASRTGVVVRAVVDAAVPYCEEVCAPGWRLEPESGRCERCELRPEAAACPAGFTLDPCGQGAQEGPVPAHCKPCPRTRDPAVHTFMLGSCSVLCRAGFMEVSRPRRHARLHGSQTDLPPASPKSRDSTHLHRHTGWAETRGCALRRSVKLKGAAPCTGWADAGGHAPSVRAARATDQLPHRRALVGACTRRNDAERGLLCALRGKAKVGLLHRARHGRPPVRQVRIIPTPYSLREMPASDRQKQLSLWQVCGGGGRGIRGHVCVLVHAAVLLPPREQPVPGL